MVRLKESQLYRRKPKGRLKSRTQMTKSAFDVSERLFAVNARLASPEQIEIDAMCDENF